MISASDSELIRRACLAQKRLTTQPLVLHSDNGSPMKGATMLETLYALGITPSNSRPRVSNDNPYAESIFKTLKYRPNYEPKGFATLEEARNWCSAFVNWYRFEHHHSGIKFLTPAERHVGKSKEITDWMDYYNNDRYQWDLEKLSPREYYRYCQTGVYPLKPGISKNRTSRGSAPDPEV